MSFVVEDGTGLVNSTSYVTVEYADLYHEDQNNTSWALATTANKQFALMRTTTAADTIWLSRWRGTKSSSSQALQWPRSDATDDDDFDLTGVPGYLEKLICEAALLELNSPGTLLASLDRGGAVKSESVASAVKIEYFEWASGTTVYPRLNDLVRPLIIAGSGQIPTSRG